MPLWSEFHRCLRFLRPACSRAATFPWMALVLFGLAIRPDLWGVTSFIRAGWLREIAYRRLLHLFHTPALRLEDLTQSWVRLALSLFRPVTVGAYRVCLADGLKIPKEGRKMPAVKALHTESQNNSKPAYIMGHSFQAVSLLVHGLAGAVLAVPLASRIHEGVVFSNRDRRSLLDKLALLFLSLAPGIDGPLLLVADAYYASRKIIEPLLRQNHHLVTRVRRNTTAYRPAPRVRKPRRGRPRVYGQKVRVSSLFRGRHRFQNAASPVYGEQGVVLRYRAVDLLWRPIGRRVRFVLVVHPTRGRLILMATDTTLAPLTIVALYGYRFKIEVSFKQAIHTLGAYAYHFWMSGMTPIKRCSGNQYLHRKDEAYRQAVRRKLGAYHRHVQLGCVAQGLLQHLAVNFQAQVLDGFRGWLRTIRPNRTLSEAVVAEALRAGFPDYLALAPRDHELKKILRRYADSVRMPRWLKVA